MLPSTAVHDTVVCLAPGPSLTREDVDVCRGVATVIAINDAVDLAPWADVLYSSDYNRWWPKRQWMPEFAGLRVRVSPTPWRRQDTKAYPLLDAHGVLVMRNTGETGLELARDALRTHKNSGGAAINLAVHLGARRVVLVGYDMTPGHYNTADQDRSPYQLFRRHLATMVAPLQAAGVAVVNCSRKSALECFPRSVLREVLVAGFGGSGQSVKPDHIIALQDDAKSVAADKARLNPATLTGPNRQKERNTHPAEAVA